MLSMTLEEIKELLLSVTTNTYHQDASTEEDEYIVWAEDGESDAVHADNRKILQVLDVTVDVFTRSEYPEIIKRLQDAFNEAELPFELLSIQHERNTGYTHYEYLIQAVI